MWTAYHAFYKTSHRSLLVERTNRSELRRCYSIREYSGTSLLAPAGKHKSQSVKLVSSRSRFPFPFPSGDDGRWRCSSRFGPYSQRPGSTRRLCLQTGESGHFDRRAQLTNIFQVYLEPGLYYRGYTLASRRRALVELLYGNISSR